MEKFWGQARANFLSKTFAKETIDKRLKTAQKELFLIRRHLLKIYSRTIGLHNLQENIVKEREKALKTKLIIHPKLFF